MAERGRDDEDGFTLVEVLVCVALIVSACVAALQLVPTLAHASQQDVLRDAATGIARTAIERARAATAYDPPSGYVAGHAYALNATAAYTAAAHVHRALCDGARAATTDVPMDVVLTYDAASDGVTATVSYPRDPCAPAARERVVVGGQLAPSALVPGTTVAVPIGDPSRQ